MTIPTWTCTKSKTTTIESTTELQSITPSPALVIDTVLKTPRAATNTPLVTPRNQSSLRPPSTESSKQQKATSPPIRGSKNKAVPCESLKRR
mmetsp:Transcript_15899/g.39470  ORF Transcript_15899/g.39470 Transcript_15899/m.39470 type:complete len:92 (-) Transcript_15899:328-603(-)